MGDNHPYPNAPKKAGEVYAEELGFEVVQAIQYSLGPGDFKAQCLSLKKSGANYAFPSPTPRIPTFRCCVHARPSAPTSSSCPTSGVTTKT